MKLPHILFSVSQQAKQPGFGKTYSAKGMATREYVLGILGQINTFVPLFCRVTTTFCRLTTTFSKTTFLPPFTTFMVRQRCRCKLVIFTNDTLSSLYNLRLHGFAFALSSIYFHYKHITRIPSYSYCWSIVKLLLVSWVHRTRDPGGVP